ncbi:drs2 neo1 protein, partial [Coemansia sp. RSA 2559]
KALIVHNMRVRCEGGGGGTAGKAAAGRGGAWHVARRCVGALAELLKHDNDKFMVTLAIGDGGNDIAMIQEAHMGIGIAGQEGLQASRSADFSIGQFRFLQKLLLVHGRWSYVRVSMFIMGTFYKCMAFYVTQLIFQFYTGFSGTSLFESWTLSMYNTLFSILPVLVVGIFEQDLQPETLMAYPELYRDMGPKNHLFTVPIFVQRVVALGVVHSIIAAYFPFASNMVLGRHAASDDQYIWSLTIYSIVVLIVTLKIAYVDVRRWVYLSHASVVLTLALWFGWNGVLCHIYPSTPGDAYNVLGTFTMLMRKGPFWFQWIIFVAVALCLNVLALLVYTMRDPVEHRIATWVAYERRKEHVRHKLQRQAWIQRRGMVSSWELLNFKWLWRGGN